MAGFGRFKLTDALPDQPVVDEESQFVGGIQGSSPPGKAKSKGKKKGKLAGDQPAQGINGGEPPTDQFGGHGDRCRLNAGMCALAEHIRTGNRAHFPVVRWRPACWLPRPMSTMRSRIEGSASGLAA